MSKEKRPVGRPKKTLDDLPDGWKDKMLELSAEGASAVELRVEALDCISQELWERLIEEEPEFSLTVKRCKERCHNWWIKNGRTNLENKDFSYTGWYMNMKNRFQWTDRQDHTTKGDKVEMVIYKDEEGL